jgi:hypothetical protein
VVAFDADESREKMRCPTKVRFTSAQLGINTIALGSPRCRSNTIIAQDDKFVVNFIYAFFENASHDIFIVARS